MLVNHSAEMANLVSAAIQLLPKCYMYKGDVRSRTLAIFPTRCLPGVTTVILLKFMQSLSVKEDTTAPDLIFQLGEKVIFSGNTESNQNQPAHS